MFNITGLYWHGWNDMKNCYLKRLDTKPAQKTWALHLGSHMFPVVPKDQMLLRDCKNDLQLNVNYVK
jgi:hypothetical protein